MVDRKALEVARGIDLLSLIGQDTPLRSVASTGGGEYAGPCPFCGGRDRLRVQPERSLWWCRQCSGEHWKDAIAYIERREGKNFVGAVAHLTQGKMPIRVSAASTPRSQPIGEPPSRQWQAIARRIIDECVEMLWSDRGIKARIWLNARGLNDETLRHWRIGFNPSNRRIAGLYVERGIVIPCLVDDQVWYVKIRRPMGEPKYVQIKGSRPALFGADSLAQHDYAIITEGEFDAMLVWQICVNDEYPPGRKRDLVGVATLGSAGSRLDVETWARYLLPVARFLICYDADAAGVKGAGLWNDLTSRARRVNVPTLRPNDKDLTDYHLAGGRIVDLVSFEIARDRWQREFGQQGHPRELRDELAELKARRDMLVTRWNNALDALEAMQERDDQNASEVERLSAEWERLDAEYRQLCDRIDCLELTQECRQQEKMGCTQVILSCK